MNISDLVTHYVTFRRTLGEKCESTQAILRSFCRMSGPQTLVARISVDAVTKFLGGTGPVTSVWHNKYRALKGFFRFAVSRGHLDKSPLPATLPKRAPSFIPYIYSRVELRRLLDAIPSYRRYPARIEPPTLRAILLLLYGAGLRVQEALGLSVEDADLSKALLTVRETKFFKSRLVPISQDLNAALTEYSRWREGNHSSDATTSHFFVGNNGVGIYRNTLEQAFRRLRRYAGIRRSDGARYQPRLHDLRHTFAVHRVTTWYQRGADVQQLLHQLSVYLGHTNLAATQVYLSMTPELLHQASQRFERYAREKGHDA